MLIRKTQTGMMVLCVIALGIPIPCAAELPWLRIGTSKIHGVGVFAVRDIPKFTRVLPQPLDRPGKEVLASSLPPKISELFHGYYCAPKGYVFIPDEFHLEPAIFLNHDRTPTLYLDEWEKTYVASRPIAEGEELTEDYRKVCDFCDDWFC
jgi:SET domain-containing protein